MTEARVRDDEGQDEKLSILWDSTWFPDIRGSIAGCADWTIADRTVEPMNGGGFQALDAVGTAIIMCLFTDRRRPDDLVAGDDSAERRGWHGDTYDVVKEDGERALGSLLWTLEREAITDETLFLAQHYASEALQPLIDQGFLSEIAVETEAVPDRNQISIGIKCYAATGEQTYAKSFTLE